MYAAFAIILAFLHVISAEHNSTLKTYRFPNKKLILSEPSFDNATLYYAVCDQLPKQCTIVREIDSFTMAAETKKCDVHLKADDVQLIVAFGKDKAILITKEATSKSSILKATTIQMSSCKSVEAKLFEIPPDWNGLQLYRNFLDVVVFDVGFEIVIKRFSDICSKTNKNKYCGFSFDADGKRVEGPFVWPRIIPYEDINVVSPILTDASGKGYFFVNENISLVGVQFDRPGDPLHVKLWGPVNISSEVPIGGHSVDNNFNGACYIVHPNIKCWQNDADGGLAMRTQFTFKPELEIWNLHVHNLPTGGLLILIIACPNRVCSGVKDHYYLIKVNAKGNTMRYLEVDLEKSKCSANNSVILAKTFVDKRGLYCSARLCHSLLPEESKLEITSNCYSDNDFLNLN